jgi:mannosyltransferase
VTGSVRPLGDPVVTEGTDGGAAAVAVPRQAGDRWRAWVAVLPGLVTFAVTMWGIGWASFWRDEAATSSATGRPLPALVRMLGHVDAVHGAYYLLMWPIAHLLGTGEVAMRLPSAVAMAGAACGIAASGRRLGCWQAGLCAGLVFAALPMTSRYGQEARSYALVTAVAVLASYLLVRVIVTPGARWLAGYAIALALLASLNIFGLLIVPAHAVTLAAARRRPAAARRPGKAGTGDYPQRRWVIPRFSLTPAAPLDSLAKSAVGQSPQGRAGLVREHGDLAGRQGVRLRGWLLAVAVAVLASAPIGLLAWRQRSQFAWLLRHRPGWPDLYALGTGLAGSAASLAAIAVLAVLGVLATMCVGACHRDRVARRRIVWLSAPWLIVPTALLFGFSEIAPAYQPRYLVFCLPAVAMLAGAVLAGLNRFLRAAGLVLLAVLGLSMQQEIRQPDGHGDNIRAAAQILRAQARPADAVIYDNPGTRTDSFAYPQAFRRLDDISLRQTPAVAGNLGGTQAPPGLVAARLARSTRVWLVEVGPQHQVPPAVATMGFRQAGVWRAGAMTLRLYVRDAPR